VKDLRIYLIFVPTSITFFSGYGEDGQQFRCTI